MHIFTARIRRMGKVMFLVYSPPGGLGTPVSGSFPGYWSQVLPRGYPSPGRRGGGGNPVLARGSVLVGDTHSRVPPPLPGQDSVPLWPGQDGIPSPPPPPRDRTAGRALATRQTVYHAGELSCCKLLTSLFCTCDGHRDVAEKEIIIVTSLSKDNEYCFWLIWLLAKISLFSHALVVIVTVCKPY